MSAIVGNSLIFGSLAYVYIAMRYARKTYGLILAADPSYFSELDKPSVTSLGWKRSLGVTKFIFDRAIDQRGYSEQLAKRIDNAKGYYFCTIFAFLAMFAGIMIR